MPGGGPGGRSEVEQLVLVDERGDLSDRRAAFGQRAEPVVHDTVDRQPLARTDAHEVADDDFADPDLDLAAVLHDAGGVGPQAEQLLHRLAGAGLHQQRQPLAEDVVARDQHGDGQERRGRVVGERAGQADQAAMPANAPTSSRTC